MAIVAVSPLRPLRAVGIFVYGPDMWPVGNQLSPSPGDRARLALLDDAERSDREIAIWAQCSPETVQAVRRELTGYGVLAPRREMRRAFPVHVPLPRSPRVLAEGACVGVLPSPWTSDDPAERTHAKIICITECHVKDACLSWALRAIPVGDSAIYAGTGPAERRRLRAQLGIRQPNGVTAINAAKACCPECGEALSGENLITEPGRRPGTVRRRCRACTQRRKAEYEPRRRAARREAEAEAARQRAEGGAA